MYFVSTATINQDRRFEDSHSIFGPTEVRIEFSVTSSGIVHSTAKIPFLTSRGLGVISNDDIITTASVFLLTLA